MFFLVTLKHTKLYAQDSLLAQNRFFSISSENDIYQYYLQSDKNFTNGLQVEFSHDVFDIKAMNWLLIGFRKPTVNQFSLSLSQDIHTPEDPTKVEVDSTDRPYAGLLYFTYSKCKKTYKLLIKHY